MTRHRLAHRLALAALTMLVALPPTSAPAAATLQEPDPDAPAAAAPLGGPAGWELVDRVTRLLAADSELFAEPSVLARSLLRLDAEVEAEVLEERGGWVRVRIGDLRGWVPLAGRGEEREPALAVGLGEEWRALQQVRLGRARALLEGGWGRRVGGLEWWTDLASGSRASDRLSELFECLPEAYRSRYGIDPQDDADHDVVVVFDRHRAYLELVEAEDAVAELGSGGFAAVGFAALYVGERHLDDVLAIAAHETTHLQNRRRLGFELPPWLEEGLAEDMALMAAAGPGCPVGGWPQVSRREWRSGAGASQTVHTTETTSGKLRSLACTVSSWRHAPLDLAELVSLEWRGFSVPQGRPARYAAAALLVRYLLEGDDGAHAAAFRESLRAGRASGDFSFVGLLERVGIDGDRLAREVMDWARAELADVPCG